MKTKAGQTEKKVSKINQDSYIQLSNFMENQEIHIFAVCDGHGQFGHQVSQFIKTNLPKNIQKWITQKPQQPVEWILIEAFKTTNMELLKSSISVDFSGSTI